MTELIVDTPTFFLSVAALWAAVWLWPRKRSAAWMVIIATVGNLAHTMFYAVFGDSIAEWMSADPLGHPLRSGAVGNTIYRLLLNALYCVWMGLYVLAVVLGARDDKEQPPGPA